MGEDLKLFKYHLTNGRVYNEWNLFSTWGSLQQEGYIVVGKKVRKLYHEVVSYERDGDCEEWHKERYYLGIIEKEELVGYEDCEGGDAKCLV